MTPRDADDWVQPNPIRRADWQEALKLVRFMEIRPGGMVWGPLLDCLEVDRPQASRSVKAERVHRLHAEGLDEAMRRVGGENRGY